MTPTSVLSIGHSNHEPEFFLDLLERHGVEVVADVRSVPRSGYSPQFDRPALERILGDRGIRYVFLGDLLGGRPTGDEYYDPSSHVRYDRLAESPEFLGGLDRLIVGTERYVVAMMCSEEDPTTCHRHLLISRVLTERGTPVGHIRKDGRVETEADLPPQPALQIETSLFGEETSTWRSIRPVSRGGPPGGSSGD